MAYHYLDNWDIKRVKDNMDDTDMLLAVIDDLITTNCEVSYDDGFNDGYDECYNDTIGGVFKSNEDE